MKKILSIAIAKSHSASVEMWFDTRHACLLQIFNFISVNVRTIVPKKQSI